MKASEVVAMVLTMIHLFFIGAEGNGQPLRLAVRRAHDRDTRSDCLVARHTVVATLRDCEPIPLGIGDGRLLPRRALRIRDRRERRGENECRGGGQNGLRDHCPVSSGGGSTPLVV
jgi:hypothetical protein